MLQTFDLSDWHQPINANIQQRALAALESGQVIFLPKLAFPLYNNELIFLSPHYVKPHSKNISFSYQQRILQGAQATALEITQLTAMMQRYAQLSKTLLHHLFPHYKNALQLARTSYRPVEIAGRKPRSYRQDDTRLHVDAFPASPTQGQRILRIFTNIHPQQLPRVWRLGAPFASVVDYFHTNLTPPYQASAFLLKALKITKKKRTLYDHYMLKLHNAMKADNIYQQQVEQIVFHFPPGSSWIVYTDQVSHAAMSGQFVLEQTGILPSQALATVASSPLKILEARLLRQLL